jgi:hypothetical protein
MVPTIAMANADLDLRFFILGDRGRGWEWAPDGGGADVQTVGWGGLEARSVAMRGSVNGMTSEIG